MNVHALDKRLRHVFVPRDRRKQTKLDLRVVGVYQNVMLVLGNEILTEASAELGADRNILQVRLCRRKSARCGPRLTEYRMDASACVCGVSESLRIGCTELCDLAIFENVANDRMIWTKLI